jgi:hypothetical protein
MLIAGVWLPRDRVNVDSVCWLPRDRVYNVDSGCWLPRDRVYNVDSGCWLPMAGVGSQGTGYNVDSWHLLMMSC